MIDGAQSEELDIRYVHDDDDLRREFARRLALFLRDGRSGVRWDITPLVDALDQLGRRIPSVWVRLRCHPARQELQVSLEFDLAPIPQESTPSPPVSMPRGP